MEYVKIIQMQRITGSLFPPEGFIFRPEVMPRDEEMDLAAHIKTLPLKEFEFKGYIGKRRVISYGWHYDFGSYELQKTYEMLEFLMPLRSRAAAFGGLSPTTLVHALITEYRPGTPIGWHRDRPVFGTVIGLSLLSPCTLRFRRKMGTKWERYEQVLDRRSAYMLTGEARENWEHSIPDVDELRYSVTFRTLK